MTDRHSISMPEAAQRLGCSRQHVHKLIKEGQLRARRDERRHWRIDPVDLAQFAATRTAPPGHLTSKQVAERVGRPHRTVQNWITQGHLPTVRVYGRNYILASILDQFTPPHPGRPRKEQP